MTLKKNGWRLPTEAEWEYCARGGEFTNYAGGNKIGKVGWHDGNSDEQTQPVGKKRANGYGLFDMSGNVWEWCWDRAEADGDETLIGQSLYGRKHILDPKGTEKGTDRINRGGSWYQ